MGLYTTCQLTVNWYLSLAGIIGRRVLSTYFLLFLQSSPELSPKHDLEEIASSTLHTNLLGEHVGHEWGVGQVLVWQPAAPQKLLNGERTELSVLRSAGLYKVQGEAVQAIMGAIYQQYVCLFPLPFVSNTPFLLTAIRFAGRVCRTQGFPHPFIAPSQSKRWPAPNILCTCG